MKRALLQPRLLTAQECAIALLYLISLKEAETGPTTRIQLSEATLRKIWVRQLLTHDFLNEIREWLSRAGWTLFYAQSTYAIVRTKIIHKWSRLSSKRLGSALSEIQKGEFNFEKHLHLISHETGTDADD